MEAVAKGDGEAACSEAGGATGKSGQAREGPEEEAEEGVPGGADMVAGLAVEKGGVGVKNGPDFEAEGQVLARLVLGGEGLGEAAVDACELAVGIAAHVGAMKSDDDEFVGDGPEAERFGGTEPHVAVFAAEVVVGGVEGAALFEDGATDEDAAGKAAAEYEVSPGDFDGLIRTGIR